MKKLVLVLILLSFSSKSFSQSDSITNSSKNWFLLFESGINRVNSKVQLHFGTGVEYSISKKSSLTFRIKYFKTGIDYYSSGSGGGLFSTPSRTFLYKGEVLKATLNYKFGDKFFFNKLRYFVAAGPALNITLNERFIEIKKLTPLNNKIYINFNLSLGLQYSLSSKLNIYLSPEIFDFGNEKSKEKIGFVFGSRLKPEEALVNIGVRYKL